MPLKAKAYWQATKLIMKLRNRNFGSGISKINKNLQIGIFYEEIISLRKMKVYYSTTSYI